jgi:hypothetical protein
MTCVTKSAVRDIGRILPKTYGQFRTTQGPTVSYLGLTWDYSYSEQIRQISQKSGLKSGQKSTVLLFKKGRFCFCAPNSRCSKTKPAEKPRFFGRFGFCEKFRICTLLARMKVSQAGMIQDIVARREKFHQDRGTKSTGIPKTPATLQAGNFWTETASLAWASTRTHSSLATAVEELQRHVTCPTTEDESKLDRLINFAKSVRDVPLRLKAHLPPRVTVSIDAAFANRTDMKSTSGACVTLGVGLFIAWSKIQKLNSKSSTHAEFIAVSDVTNTPLWLADFIHRQGYPLYA